MYILTSPSYIVAILLALVFPWGKPWSFFFVAPGLMVLFRLTYDIARWRLAVSDGRPPAAFIAGVIGLQLVALVGVVLLVSKHS